jgi:hypothetical protein
MWKLGLRPRYSQKRNTSVGFSLQCGSLHETFMIKVQKMFKYFIFAGKTSSSQPSQQSGSSTAVATTPVSTATAKTSAEKPKKPSTDQCLSTIDSNAESADLKRSLVLDPELAEPAVTVISGKSSLNTSHHLGSLSRALGTRDHPGSNHE